MNKERKEFWANKKVVITGGGGFLGKHLVKKLKKLEPKKIVVPRSHEYDLRSYDICKKILKNSDIVIHLAAKVGGIGYNKKHPAELFFDNIELGTNVLKASFESGVDKFVGIGTVCSYPKYTKIPFMEKDLWNGYPEETNAPYGLAKKMLLVGGQALNKQYGFNAIHLLPVNLYGPGDNFNPRSSHVIPALIKKFIEAKEQKKREVVVWGTGNATREFLYVEDAAEAILLATEKYCKPNPINLGSGKEISIRDLSKLIAKLTNFQGKIIWDNTKPDGQPRRMLDTSKAKKEFGFKAQTSFKVGLNETIKWYKKNIYQK